MRASTIGKALEQKKLYTDEVEQMIYAAIREVVVIPGVASRIMDTATEEEFETLEDGIECRSIQDMAWWVLWFRILKLSTKGM